MKRLAIWITVIAVTAVALDVAFGRLFGLYVDNIGLKGDYENSENIFRGFDADLAILGSSVALNSIDPTTLGDSLGVNAISGGGNGQSFPFYLTSLKAIVEQHVPGTVILGMTPSNLADTGVGYRYNFLAPYYGMGIADIDRRLGEAYGDVLIHSNFYRLNTIWFRILLYNFISSGVKGQHGFVGKPVQDIHPEPVRVSSAPYDGISSERRAQLLEFIGICRDNGIRLLVLFTPLCQYYADGFTDPVISQTAELCRRQGVEFYDDTASLPLSRDNTLFYDGTHLNVRGTEIYTDIIIDRLK